MTAVLSASDAFRRDRKLSSLDDSSVNYTSSPPTDWKTKYFEVADLLDKTRNDLDEFEQSSKELEDELNRHLDEAEKEKESLERKVTRAQTDRDDWKAKYVSLQTNYNSTTASLQRELDTLRQSEQALKVSLRDLEMGNDDLERSERAASSNLADTEAKYLRVLEEKILLEQDLLNKATLEEDVQRLKDELRDASVEVTILKDQLTQAKLKPDVDSRPSLLRQDSDMSEQLKAVSPPADMSLSELNGPEPDTARSSTESSGQAALLRRTGLLPPVSRIASPIPASSSTTPKGFVRSTTMPAISPSRLPGLSTSVSPRPGITRNPSKIKAVQMASAMTNKLSAYGQRLNTAVPQRLRMPSLSKSAAPVATAATATAQKRLGMSQAPSAERTPIGRPHQRRSFDVDGNSRPRKEGDGWVFVMEEESPLVGKEKEKDKTKEARRTSSPSAPSSFRPLLQSNTFQTPSPVAAQTAANTQINARRPLSRLSVGSESRTASAGSTATATSSSIPTPTSRPNTPTFLPVPTTSLAGGIGGKRSTGASALAKRSSLGHNSVLSRTSAPNDSESQSTRRPGSSLGLRSSQSTVMAPPPDSAAPSRLAKSQISRPTSLSAGFAPRRRGSAAHDSKAAEEELKALTRARSGSTTTNIGRR